MKPKNKKPVNKMVALSYGKAGKREDHIDPNLIKSGKVGKYDMKWADFARYYFDKKSKTYNDAENSAIRAGFKESYAKTITTRSGYVKVRQGMAGALEKIGVDDDYLAKNVKELLDAEAITIVKNKAGGVIVEQTYMDSKAKNFGLTHAIAVRGDKAADKLDVNVNEEVMEALEKLRQVITVRPSGSKE